MNRYPMTVFWSDEDECWIAEARDLRRCSAFGDSPQEAVAELQTAIELWLEVAAEKGMKIPVPSPVRTAA